MSTVRELHDKAVNLAQLALVAREKGDSEKAEALAIEAYEYESQAADLVSNEEQSEPTLSILYSSAASLAYQGRKFDVALQLVAKGLSGYPPPQVKEELKALIEQCIRKVKGKRKAEGKRKDLLPSYTPDPRRIKREHAEGTSD